jgi:SAM-dependent methyltransferase
MQSVTLHPTCCAICHTEGNATELYPAIFDNRSFSAATFSARRVWDEVHYRIVKCNTCGLVRSDPVADSSTLAELYAQSAFNYEYEVDNIKATYGHYLAQIARYHTRKGALLEIGCGNGFFLEEALAQGYGPVYGIETSRSAIESASSLIRNNIICDTMRPGIFSSEQFEIICMFQVLDHIPEPSVLLDECHRILKPGGIILSLNHNVEAVSSRLLRQRSPIIDIEHTFLYSPSTIVRLFVSCGFGIEHLGSAWNRYSLYYLTRLVPWPIKLRPWVVGLVDNYIFRRLSLSVPLGNLYIIGKKPLAMLRKGVRNEEDA